MFYVYILQSLKDNSYYIGSTRNYEKRFEEHNQGKSRYSKSKMPWVLKHYEIYNTLSEARKREKYIKSLKSRLAIEKIINKAPIV